MTEFKKYNRAEDLVLIQSVGDGYMAFAIEKKLGRSSGSVASRLIHLNLTMGVIRKKFAAGMTAEQILNEANGVAPAAPALTAPTDGAFGLAVYRLAQLRTHTELFNDAVTFIEELHASRKGGIAA